MREDVVLQIMVIFTDLTTLETLGTSLVIVTLHNSAGYKCSSCAIGVVIAPGPGLHPVDEPHVTVQYLDVLPAQAALVLGVVDGLQLLNWLRRGDILSAEILILHILIRFCREVVIFLRLYGLPPQQSGLLGNHVDVPLSLGQIALQVLVVPQVELGTALGVAEVAHGGRVGDVHVEELVVKVTVLVIVVIAVAIVLLIIVTFIFEVSIDFIYSCKK